MRRIQSRDVRDLWQALSEEYGTKVIPKERSPLMRAAGSGLALLRIQTKAEFMAHYTTVIHRRIYVPYVPGDAKSEAKLWYQASTGVHEHQHVVQANRDGFARFGARYLASPKWRAFYEAEAYGGDIEFLRWAGQSPRGARAIANALKHYGISGAPMDAAFETLRTYEAGAKRGELQNVCTRWAQVWMKARLNTPALADDVTAESAP